MEQIIISNFFYQRKQEKEIILCSGGRFVALLWSKKGGVLKFSIPLRIIKTHLKDNKSNFADDKSE